MKTIEEFYDDLLIANRSWVAPVLEKFEAKCLSGYYFSVEIKSFNAIDSVPFLRMLSVRKSNIASRTSTFTIYFEIIR